MYRFLISIPLTEYLEYIPEESPLGHHLAEAEGKQSYRKKPIHTLSYNQLIFTQ